MLEPLERLLSVVALESDNVALTMKYFTSAINADPADHVHHLNCSLPLQKGVTNRKHPKKKIIIEKKRQGHQRIFCKRYARIFYNSVQRQNRDLFVLIIQL